MQTESRHWRRFDTDRDGITDRDSHEVAVMAGTVTGIVIVTVALLG